MNVKVYGFEWRFPPVVTCADFASWLATISGKTYDNQMLAVTQKCGYWVGLLLTDKPGKSYCQKLRDGPTFKVTPQALRDGESIVDFNFFLLCEHTGRGLYQYYHNSARMTQFNRFCSGRFEELKGSKLREQLAALGDDDGAQRSRVQDQFEPGLQFAQLYKPESIDKLVAKMKRVRFLECECVTLRSVEEDFRPVSGVAKRVSHRFVFHRKGPMENIKAIIAELVTRSGMLKAAKISGIDDLDQSVAYDLFQTPDCFSEADYDDWIGKVNIDSTRLIDCVQESAIVAALIELAKQTKIQTLLTVPAQ